MKISERSIYYTEVPAPSNNSCVLEQSVGAITGYHDYSLPRDKIAYSNKHYDQPRKQKDFLAGSEGTSRATATTESGTRNHANIRNYDVPKDTLNTEVLKGGSETAPPGSPTKHPLINKESLKHSGSHKSMPRSPPPTIVLSPPEETSPEKAKVIFEYDNEKFMAKLAEDDTTRPNFLIRYKKSIMIVAVTLLMFLVLILVVLMVYAAHQRRY